MAVINSSMVKITFVVAEISGCNYCFSGQDHFCSGLDNFESGCGNFFSGQDHFVVVEITFKLALVTSSVPKAVL